MLLPLFLSLSPEDEDLLLDIYQNKYPILFSAAFRIVKDKNTADDMVQDAVVKLMKDIPKLRTFSKDHRIAYSVLTVQHLSISYLRKYKRRLYNTFDWMDKVFLTPAEIVEKDEDKASVHSMLNQLKPRDRLLLVYKYFMEYNNKEIGRLLNIKSRYVSTYIKRAREAAFEVMQNRGDQE